MHTRPHTHTVPLCIMPGTRPATRACSRHLTPTRPATSLCQPCYTLYNSAQHCCAAHACHARGENCVSASLHGGVLCTDSCCGGMLTLWHGLCCCVGQRKRVGWNSLQTQHCSVAARAVATVGALTGSGLACVGVVALLYSWLARQLVIAYCMCVPALHGVLPNPAVPQPVAGRLIWPSWPGSAGGSCTPALADSRAT